MRFKSDVTDLYANKNVNIANMADTTGPAVAVHNSNLYSLKPRI